MFRLFFSLLITGTIALSNAVLLRSECGTRAKFDTWQRTHNKTYASDAERAQKYAVFRDNDCFVQHHVGTHQLKMNHFGDLTPTEFKAQFATGYMRAPPSISRQFYGTIWYQSLPSNVDWRNSTALTPVKNQGQCGSCWTFSAAESIESAIAIKDRKPAKPLSEQQLVDCVADCHGCNGGSYDEAFAYVQQHGLESEQDYPYTAQQGQCRATKAQHSRVTGYINVPTNNPKALAAAVTLQPVSVAIEADAHVFQFYHAGIIQQNKGCGTNLDHAVLLVGYTTDYWIIRNSWGPTWGMDGFVLLARDPDQQGPGTCGVQADPTRVLVE